MLQINLQANGNRSGNRSIQFLLPLFLLLAITAIGQTDVRPFTLNRSVTHDLHSDVNGRDYRLFISLPQSYNPKDTTHYRTLYLLDGNPFFPLVQSMHDFFVVGDEVPEMIIVGIGYPLKESVETMGPRTLDLTPTHDPQFDTMMAKYVGGPVTSGGAPSFLKVIKEEVMPFVESMYKTSGDRALAGHSFGALFATYVLFNEPQLFNRYLLSSVSFPWDKEMILKQEQAFYEKGNKTLNAKVFISVGETEGNIMVPPMKQLATAMRAHNYKGLELEEKVFPNESHVSVVATSFSQGLRSLYKGIVVKKW